MYLHLGEETVVRFKDIVTVLDIETATIRQPTREFLKKAEQDLIVTTIGTELPKSVVLCSDGYGNRVYLSQISSKTLKKRCESLGGMMAKGDG